MKNNISYRVNQVLTTKSMAEWYFGEAFVATCTDSAKRKYERTGEASFKFWQNGTGWLMIDFH